MRTISGNPYLKKENEKILIDSLYLHEFLANNKTPLIIFVENRIRENINSFINVFRTIFKNYQCFYSFKANYLPEICKIVLSEGIGAEIVGLPELRLALKIGFSPDNIIIGGPYLSKELIEKSVETNVKEIITYNLDNLKKINEIALRFNRVQKVCIRVNSLKYNSKLGVIFNERNSIRLKKILKSCQNIKITTILSHFGTQMNNIKQFNTNLKAIIDAIKSISRLDINIKNINIGGGFPEAVVMNQDELKNCLRGMKKTLNNFGIKSENVYVEPGRYFIGDAGLFVAKITHVGENRWIFLNIGTNICPKFARCSLRFYNASRINEPHKYKTSIAGIVPTDQDVLAKDYFFSEHLKKGDIVLITNIGAYTLTFSNRFPYELPNVFLVKEDRYRNIFNPSVHKDFFLE